MDPVVLFGDAEEANLAWGRLYLDRREYRSLQGPTRTLAFTFMVTLLVFPTRLAFPACWVAEGLAVLSLLVLWLLTRHHPPARQASLRLNVAMTLLGVMQGAALIWPRDTALIFQLTASVQVLVALGVIAWFPREDARVRRTVALECPAAGRP